jgi:DNA-binding transcriptional ArsR family regulator
MNMVALGVAKLSFGSLSTMQRYLGNDLEVGLIGFAVVLRTRRDWFEYVHHHGLTDEVVGMINSHKGYTTSIYEIANFTGISRATVRRKMAKLEKLGIVERTKKGSWNLIDFQHGGAVTSRAHAPRVAPVLHHRDTNAREPSARRG